MSLLISHVWSSAAPLHIQMFAFMVLCHVLEESSIIALHLLSDLVWFLQDEHRSCPHDFYALTPCFVILPPSVGSQYYFIFKVHHAHYFWLDDRTEGSTWPLCCHTSDMHQGAKAHQSERSADRPVPHPGSSTVKPCCCDGCKRWFNVVLLKKCKPFSKRDTVWMLL